MPALENDSLVKFPRVCHIASMAKKKAKKRSGKNKTVAVREWAPGQPFDSVEKRPANSVKKVKI
jgi:hypothetical protein